MISKDKQYRTREGREVRIYTTDGGGNYPVHGSVWSKEDGEWHCRRWRENGNWLSNTHINEKEDLIEVKPRIKREVWVNVYPDSTSGGHWSKTNADAWACKDRIACVKLIIDCEEGEGL